MSGARSARTPTNRRSRTSSSCTIPPPRLAIPEEPPKVPRRPPSKGNKRETLADIAKRIPIQLMRLYFNYPLRSAAEAMHISVTTLKRLCRRHGVKRWPHRQISGINRALHDLEAQHQVAGEDTDLGAVADQLRQLHRRREVIIELAFESDEEGSRKNLSDDAPPAAHKRVNRSISTETNGPPMATTPSPLSRSDSIGSAASLDSAPESPGSVTSLDSKPTSVWWQHTPAVGDPSMRIDEEDDKAKIKGSRPRQSGDAGLASPRGRVQRNQRPSSRFSDLIRSDGGDTIMGQHRRKGNMVSGDANANSTMIPTTNAKTGTGSSPSFPTKRTTPGSRAASTTKVPAYMEMSVATAAAAAAAGRAGGNMFDPHMNVNQQMDDLSALGDLLFGPDDTAATAELRGPSAPSGVFSPHASQWAPCVHFSQPEMFAHDAALFGMPTTSGMSTNDFTSGWGALVHDRNNIGMSANVGLL